MFIVKFIIKSYLALELPKEIHLLPKFDHVVGTGAFVLLIDEWSKDFSMGP